MLATLCSLLFNVNRGDPKETAETYPSQFLATWILPNRIPLDSPSRRYPYKPPSVRRTPEEEIHEMERIFDAWNSNPNQWGST